MIEQAIQEDLARIQGRQVSIGHRLLRVIVLALIGGLVGVNKDVKSVLEERLALVGRLGNVLASSWLWSR